MKIEKQVCTFEQAKRLKELGVEQVSFFYHYQTFINSVEEFKIIPSQYEDYGSILNTGCIERVIGGMTTNQFYSAFTVAELGVMLPPDLWASYSYTDDELSFACHFWKQIDDSQHFSNSFYRKYAETEAEARANILILLLQNLRITPEEVNARLKD